MSEIDRQRIAAVKTLQTMGFKFDKGEWKGNTAPASTADAVKLRDALDLIYNIRSYHFEQRASGHWPLGCPFEVASRKLLGL